MDSIGDFIAFVGAGLVKAGEGLQEMIGVGLQTAPALVLGLSVIVALPVLILAGMVLRRVTPVGEGTSRYFGPLPEEIKDERGDDEGPSEAYSEAFIFVESDGGNGTGTGGFQFTDGSMMVRIGREEDNEIRLTHPTVHRYHALIRRSIRMATKSLICRMSAATACSSMEKRSRIEGCSMAMSYHWGRHGCGSRSTDEEPVPRWQPLGGIVTALLLVP